MNEQKAVTEFDKANQLLQEGKLEDAIASYCRAIELNPANSWFHQQLGEALAKLGRWDEAVTAFRCAIELNPEFSWSYHHLGDALAQQHKWEQAVDALSKAIELNPEHFGTYCGLGQSLEKLGLLNEAIAAYRRASELNPDADGIHHALANALQQRTQSDLAEAIAAYHHMIELNPDNVEGYHNLLQLQPDNWETWLQLAQALVRQEQMEDASVAYHRAIEINPKCFLSHQQLGQVLANQGNVAGAIAYYRRAIEIDPESVEVIEHLWAQLSRQREWEQAVDIYCKILEANPEQALAHYHLGAALTNLCRWEEATASYQRAIELNLEYSFWPHQLLGSVLVKQGKLNEAIVAYQKGLDIKPNGWGYFDLGMLFLEQNRLDDALLCYHKAVEIEPNQPQAYSSLQEILTRACHQLGIHEAEKGLLDEAVACFQKAPPIAPSLGDVYEYLWKGLNQQGVLDESSHYCQKEILRESVEVYFARTCIYKTINLWNLTNDDKEYLKNTGLSLDQIELTIRDQRSLEKIYTSSFGISPLKDYPQKEPKNGQLFQQSIVESSYIYTPCLFTGKILRSNQSYVIGGIWPTPIHFYRFVGQEVFYLLVGDWIGDKMYIYIPSRELIIQSRPLVSKLQGGGLLNKFKGYMLSEWKQVLSYLSNPHKELAAVLGFFGNIGHYTWNDLTGIEYLNEKKLLTKINKFIVGSFEYFNVVDIWPEDILPNKMIQIADAENLFQTVLASNCFTFRVTDLFITEDLTKRITKASCQRCSQDFLQQIEIAQQHFPLLSFQIRVHIRFWLSQVEGIANIINKLSKDYPDLGVVFDGWSRTEIESPGDNEMIALENGVVAKIIDRLDEKIKIYNAIGCQTYEKVVWAQAVDTYIAPFGSGLTFLNTIANKTGVVYGDVECADAATKNFLLYRENWNPYLLVAGYHREGDPTPAVHRNYDCDWSAIYDEVVKIINGLSKKDKRAGIKGEET